MTARSLALFADMLVKLALDYREALANRGANVAHRHEGRKRKNCRPQRILDQIARRAAPRPMPD
jgi:hypothetical protein